MRSRSGSSSSKEDKAKEKELDKAFKLSNDLITAKRKGGDVNLIEAEKISDVQLKAWFDEINKHSYLKESDIIQVIFSENIKIRPRGYSSSSSGSSDGNNTNKKPLKVNETIPEDGIVEFNPYNRMEKNPSNLNVKRTKGLGDCGAVVKAYLDYDNKDLAIALLNHGVEDKNFISNNQELVKKFFDKVIKNGDYEIIDQMLTYKPEVFVKILKDNNISNHPSLVLIRSIYSGEKVELNNSNITLSNKEAQYLKHYNEIFSKKEKEKNNTNIQHSKDAIKKDKSGKEVSLKKSYKELSKKDHESCFKFFSMLDEIKASLVTNSDLKNHTDTEVLATKQLIKITQKINKKNSLQMVTPENTLGKIKKALVLEDKKEKEDALSDIGIKSMAEMPKLSKFKVKKDFKTEKIKLLLLEKIAQKQEEMLKSYSSEKKVKASKYR